MNSVFTVMINILKTNAAKFSLFIIHYFDADRLGTGFKCLLQGDWLFFSENKLIPEYLKPCVYGVKTPKQEGSYSRHNIKRKRQVKIIIKLL